MKRTAIFIGIIFISIIAKASETNAPPPENFQNISNQELAVAKVMPEYFKFKTDIVNEITTISLNQLDYLAGGDNINSEIVYPADKFRPVTVVPIGGDGYSIKMDILAPVHKSKHFADYISFEFISHTSQWVYLNDHDFTVRYDTNKIEIESGYSNAINGDGTVVEQFFVTFTPEQFHEMAWADVTAVKLGSENYLIPPDDRTKWKLLWNYFNLNKKLNR